MTVRDEALEFGRSVEAIFLQGLAAQLTPELRAKLKQAGLDLDKPLLPGYPARVFHGWLRLAATELYPTLAPNEALREVGQLAVKGNEVTLLGRAVVSALKLIGPRRAFGRAERIFRNNGNYQTVVVSDLSDRGATVALGYVFGMPTYYQGVFEAAMLYTGAKSPKVRLVNSDGEGAILKLEWDV